MYEKNLLNRADFTPKFENGFTAFIEWVKSQHAYMDSEKIRCPCRKYKNEVFKTPDEDEQTPPAPADKGTNTHCGADEVHAAEQPLWNGCTQSQLGVIVELVDIKANSYISQRIYNRISQWTEHILPCDHTLPLDYYNTKKLINYLGLPMEKIDACRNDCMLYWKDDIDLDYDKFCGEARYQPTRERNPNRKKIPYAILRYLPLTPRLQRLYASQATAEQMT
ncbi:UNVERIFIED_CONTAM: hypothetical protein Slati_0450500 [Sesamum latifolium]|uniref:Transposase-associated domain-containing protein n=1 Tax=Sesamum latifolium TaxID=2727402 RepID=A0AAW2XVU0_9LAMI